MVKQSDIGKYYETIGGDIKEIVKPERVNPMVRTYGVDPAGHKCKACVFFYRKEWRAGKYFKCKFRGNTNGPGTDHRANWPACKKFEETKNG